MLACICDNNTKKLDEIYEYIKKIKTNSKENNPSIEKFKSYEELLFKVKQKKIKLDLIVITTPSGFHAEQVKMAANHGINVCTEKPMSTNWSDAKSMVNSCDKNKVKFFVVKQNRLNSTLQLLKKQIDNGRFGKIALVSVNVFWSRGQDYYDQDKWRGTWEFDGGALMNQASHYVDLLTWLIGPVESIGAKIATIARNIEVEDTAVLNLKWRNGALGSMSVTMVTYPKNLEGSITILGDQGTAKVGGLAVNQIQEWKFSTESQNDKYIEQASYNTTNVYGSGHIPYYTNMLDTLLGDAKAICDGKEGLKSLELLIGAYRSAKENKIINFPLD